MRTPLMSMGVQSDAPDGVTGASVPGDGIEGV